VTARWLAPLSSALEAARRTLAETGRLELSGPLGPARPLVGLLITADPLLVVVPQERDVERVASDLRTLAAEAGETGAVMPFPSPGPAPYRGLPRHPEASLRRASALHAARRGGLRALVASPAGLLRPVLTPAYFETRALTLRAGEEMTPEILLEALDEGGYRREDPVTAPGQIARRGGIVDVFPPDREEPVRIEFFGDLIDSLRSFEPESQRASGGIPSLEILPLLDVFPTRSLLGGLPEAVARRFPTVRERPAFLEKLERGLAADQAVELLPLIAGATTPAWTYLERAVAVAVDPEAVALEADSFLARAREERDRREDALLLEPEESLVAPSSLVQRLAAPPRLHLREVDLDSRGRHLACRPVRRYAGDLKQLAADLRSRSGRTVLFLGSPGRADRLRDVLLEDGIAAGEDRSAEIRVGALSAGFELPDLSLIVLADGDVFPEEVHLHPRGRRASARSFLSDFRDLRIGDLVVHQDHGIGRYLGLETIEVGGVRGEFMVLGYQAGDKLKVPVEAFDRIQKYSATEGARPQVDRLGSGRWETVKRRVKKAMRDMATELLRLYAERKARPGHAFAGESPWQREFEEAFEYEETPDQALAIGDVTADMARPSPMDRLICGDVGYGKTEVAMRAAIRAVLDGKQVAVLAPTTVLAFQHWKTFRTRFAPFPVVVEMVSRFRPAREIKKVLADLAAGKVDILIGTHRLLSRDVMFQDLGLVVIDEEQRFGVAAKEKLKQLRRTVDCLALSATPIPRTLQMGLAGIRDMSVIETPPKDRLAIMTSIVQFSTEVVAAAIRQELARDGQVYFVHNRVESIYSLSNLVQRLVPEARVVVAHGQMPEAELEKNMLAFVEARADVLVATTIIENGLDIPRVNTILVNRADRFGLAQLYQLRGRVGRSDRRAYAYLLVPPDTVLSEIARKRLAAIREFSELGAGFRVAALDLELRGAGNLLGGEQSGHIQAVGFDLYMKLLEQTILELTGESPPEGPRVSLNLGLDLRVPAEYVPETNQRMAVYKRLSQARSPEEIGALRSEIRDRYGPPPLEVDRLLKYAAVRLRAEESGLVQVDRTADGLHLRFGAEATRSPQELAAWVGTLAGASVSVAGVVRVPVAAAETGLEALGELLEGLQASRCP
jgi:transcription-repair coupling factor (superfamily II helicase)